MTESMTPRDRKEYWREYQKARYERKKASRAFAVGAGVEAQAKYLQAVIDMGLTDHKFWRSRQKLRKQIFQEADDEFYINYMWKVSKQNASARGIEFTIQPEDLIAVTHCPILGEKLDYRGLGVIEATHKPSIDRIDNFKGYVPGNVQIISLRANTLKRDSTLAELIKLGEWARTQKKLGEAGTPQRDSHQPSLDSHQRNPN